MLALFAQSAMLAAHAAGAAPSAPGLAAEHGIEMPVHPAVIGVVAFGLLFLLLVFTLAFGKGRPHE